MSTEARLARIVSLVMRVRWAVALRVARRVTQELRSAHGRLDTDERRRLAELVRHSGGRPTRLSRTELSEAARLAQKAVGFRT